MALTPATMAEALWIGAADGKNHFNVGIGQGTTSTPNDHIDYTQAEIEAGYTDATKFFLNASFNPCFAINAGAGTTSTNTVHPRSELRELLADGSNAAWDGRTGTHQMQGRSRMTTFSDARSWICFFQAHGSSGSPNSSDLFRVQTEGTSAGQTTNLSVVCRRTPPGSSSEIRTVLRTGYAINTWISWQAAIVAGRLTIAFDNATVLDATGMGQILCYWKTGCYLQDGPTHGATSSSVGTVEMQKGSLQVWHTGYPAPTTPIFTGPDDGLGGATDTTPPTVPADLAVIRGSTAATLVWEASTDNVGVDHYVVYRSSSGGGGGTATANLGKLTDGPASSASSANKTLVSTATSTQSGTLAAGHARLWVTASTASVEMVVYADSAGVPGARLATSNTVVVSGTVEAQVDFTFTGGDAIAITSGTAYWIGFTWADPGSNSINWSRDANTGLTQTNASHGANPFGTPGTALSGPIDAFLDVTYTTDGASSVGTPTSTTFTDTGLTNGVEYTYQVSAKDAAGNESAPCDAVSVTPGTPDTTAPSVPANLAATAGDRQAALTWDASTDADTGVRDYRVYRGGTLVATTTDTAYTDTELTNGQQYSYTVSARDESLNESAQSGAVTPTPHAPAIAGVPFLTAELGADAKLGVEVAFGADLSADSSTWTWTDVTTDVRAEPGISTSLGRNDESSTSNPATLTLALTNTSGDYSKGGRSRHWPYVRRNTPVRVRIDPDDDGGGRVVFLGGAVGWRPGWDSVSGRIPVVALTAAGTLRRLAQGDSPIQSAMRRAMTATSTVVSYWPMEEGDNATYAPALRGGGNMKMEGSADWGADTTFDCSAQLPQLKNARLTAFPVPYTITGAVQVRCLLMLPESVTEVSAGAYVMSVFTTGTLARWDIIHSPPFGLTLNRYNDSGSLNSTDTIGFALNGLAGRLSLELRQSGSDITWRLAFIPARVGASFVFFGGTITGKTLGIVSWVQFGANQVLGSTVIGHLTVENAITTLFGNTDALTAFDGEVASSGNRNPIVSRMERLCSENGVPLTRYTSALGATVDVLHDFDKMGPQSVAPLLTLLRDAEAADGGQLWDGRAHGLSYTTRRRREDGIVKLAIDAAAGELAAGFKPTDDDQRTRNKVEVKRAQGITAVHEDVTGPLGTGVIGIYDDSVTLNLGRDEDVVQHAQWQVALGTADVEGYRYPSVTVDLRVSPHLAAAVLDLVPGERIDVTGLDDTLDSFTAPSVSLIVEGIAHEITPKTWRATFKCSLFEPWAVGQVAAETGDTSDMLMRLDTDGSELAVNAPVGGRTLNVATGATDTPWTSTVDDYPLMLQVGGLPIRALGCTAYSAGGTGTLGKITDGSSSTASSTDKMTASQAVSAVAGTLTAGHARVWVTGGSSSVRMLVYADDAGSPGVKLATSDQVTLSATSEAVVDFTFTGGQQIGIAPIAYWIALAWSDPGASSFTLSRDSTSNGRAELTITYGTFPSPWGVPALFSGVIDAYLDVTQPAGQVLAVDPLRITRAAGDPVQLWEPRRVGMG